MKNILAITVVLIFCGISNAQTARKENPTALPATLSGEVIIREVSGNNIGNATCGNFTVVVAEWNAAWKRGARPVGNFSSRRCSFKVSNIPPGAQFRLSIGFDFPNACDEKKFETSAAFPMALKPGEQSKYNFEVTRIRCVLVK